MVIRAVATAPEACSRQEEEDFIEQMRDAVRALSVSEASLVLELQLNASQEQQRNNPSHLNQNHHS